MAFAYCPDCSARIYLGRKPWIGQPITCDYCEADLAVVQVNPPRLDWSDGDWEEEPELEPSDSVAVHVRS
jgi:lysine biosynthesis protein LysW